ncbi:hypothetical protein ACWGF3_00040 [Streptomyces xanthophaeus]|uniref:Uncharacterized protein n=1 Tax=Streptomyces xanthophaeus TaxID=67385 RepID=A0A919GUW8_9ACTN|nr:hypothetical protein [Streptomyces xanthophaeus]WST26608.1 hypothetical protein OG264_36855 [Streptomyces xanthophaeus]WST58420.1 hypothetical protein OG605_01580 [Streptomyces xanthophaeus]GHI85137.1 hypothetical protein Sxan_25010 [Streptomyces xanthophaeus]
MGGRQDKRQEHGKDREEKQRLQGPSQDPVHPGTGREPVRGKSPEELKPRREDDPAREREQDDGETRDAEL